MRDGPHTFTVRIGGALHNAGQWLAHGTVFTGEGPRHLSQESYAVLVGEVEIDWGVAFTGG